MNEKSILIVYFSGFLLKKTLEMVHVIGFFRARHTLNNVNVK